MEEETLTVKVVCRDLPGIRFGEDAPGEKAKEPVH